VECGQHGTLGGRVSLHLLLLVRLAVRQTATNLMQDSVTSTKLLRHLIETVQCSLVANTSDYTGNACSLKPNFPPPPTQLLTQSLHSRTASALGGCIRVCDWVSIAMLADRPRCVGWLVHCTVHCKQGIAGLRAVRDVCNNRGYVIAQYVISNRCPMLKNRKLAGS